MREWKSGAIVGEVKASREKGVVEAEFSVFGNLDEDGDVVEPGAFTEAFEKRTPAVVYSHLWQIPPIGETLEAKETSTGAYGKSRFFLQDHEIARQVYAGVKSGALAEWSYHYRVAEGGQAREYSKVHGQEVNFLRKFSDIFEWGPTLVGSNHETSTLSVKSPLLKSILEQAQESDDYLKLLSLLAEDPTDEVKAEILVTAKRIAGEQEIEEPPVAQDEDDEEGKDEEESTPDPERQAALLDMRFDMPPDLLVSGR